MTLQEKNILTSLDKSAIIVNCIIIAYYAQFAGKQVFVSINLFEYSNGGVALDPTIYDDATVASYNLIKTARLNHNRFSLVDRSEATIGFEIYDDAGNPFRVREEDDTINPDFDIPKINGVPFTGRKNVFVEGRNTRQITVNATHSGSTLLEAGPHDWEVLKYAPRAGHTYENKDVDTCKIFEKNYTTKKDKGNTGLGLWKIHDILRKDNSLELFTTKDEIMFKQKLEIYGKNV